MKIIITIQFLWIGIFSCTGQSELGTLEAYFRPDEIVEIQMLIDFVEKEIMTNCKHSKQLCYKGFFDEFQNMEANMDLELPLSKSGQLQLLENLDAAIFNDIWRICENEKSFKKDSTVLIQRICPNSEGRFARFLTDLTMKHRKLAQYGSSFEATGDFTPAMNGILLKHHDWFDIESQDELVLLAIHLLTLNYPDTVKKLTD
jgi:hypothetical protein